MNTHPVYHRVASRGGGVFMTGPLLSTGRVFCPYRPLGLRATEYITSPQNVLTERTAYVSELLKCGILKEGASCSTYIYNVNGTAYTLQCAALPLEQGVVWCAQVLESPEPHPYPFQRQVPPGLDLLELHHPSLPGFRHSMYKVTV